MKNIAYLSVAMIGAIILGGISTANAQTSSRTDRPTKPVAQLDKKKDAGRHMLNGHLGMKDRRKGYRRHSDGYWYPSAAFADKPLREKPTS
ncbi:hypothetical protein J2858_004646 [Neorhizobium galegae]|uniref:hypothetical protein n=1 Tax=Neorhizobium galegae TaxID=399 RepID=UPI001AE13524|nr:hypothetical protein [Neorhizobium galegae]MBP2551704.1 hypothetical protein [Neorhizobium galegae]